MHKKQVAYEGVAINIAKKALVMIHGRGGTAEDILSLSPYFKLSDFALIAPLATNNSWYPNSFLAPVAQNEPWLSSALALLKDVTGDLEAEGIRKDAIYFLGFSQGACLALEFVTRHAARYGGVIAFTGGLIGDKIDPENYSGDFGNTSVFIGSGDPDPHVPIERVHATSRLLRSMNANVTEKIYTNMGHTINQDEIDQANTLIFKN